MLDKSPDNTCQWANFTQTLLCLIQKHDRRATLSCSQTHHRNGWIALGEADYIYPDQEENGEDGGNEIRKGQG